MSEVDSLLGGTRRSSSKSAPSVRYSSQAALNNSQSTSSRSVVEPIRLNLTVDPQRNPTIPAHSQPNSVMPVPAHSQPNSVMPIFSHSQPNSGFSDCIPHRQNQDRNEHAAEQGNIASRARVAHHNDGKRCARLSQGRSISLKLKYASAGLLLSGVIVMTIVLLIMMWVATSTSDLDITTLLSSYTVFVGVTLSILVCVALPACVRYLKVNGEPRGRCSAKLTLYVSVFLAVSFAFFGATIVSLLQIVFTTECSNSEYRRPSKQGVQAWGSIIFIFSIFTAVFCFFVATITIWAYYKDGSRKYSNFCVKMFVLQVLLHLSSILTLAMTAYTSLSTYLSTVLVVVVTNIEGGVVGILLLCLIFAGPILCILESTKHRYFTKISGIYMAFISLVVTAGSLAASIVLIVLISTSRTSQSDGPYYDCLYWHRTPGIVMSVLSVVLNLCVACLGLVSFVFGCYGLWSRNAH